MFLHQHSYCYVCIHYIGVESNIDKTKEGVPLDFSNKGTINDDAYHMCQALSWAGN